jgi:flagellar biosynthesis protein FlhG
MVENLIALTKKYLNIDVTLSGYLVESDNVRKSVDEMIPFMLKDPESKPGEGLQDILRGLTGSDINIKMTDDIFAATTANMNDK